MAELRRHEQNVPLLVHAKLRATEVFTSARSSFLCLVLVALGCITELIRPATIEFTSTDRTLL